MNTKEINKVNKTIRRIFELKDKNTGSSIMKANKMIAKLREKYEGIEIYDGFEMRQY